MLYPIRDLGSEGVNTDSDPFSSSIKSFTFAANARFEDKKITRGPVFMNSGVLITAALPRFVVSYKQDSGTAQFHIGTYDGRIIDWQSGGLGAASVETDISIAAYVPATYDEPYTSTLINNVVYVNRPDRSPWYKTKAGTSFTVLPNAGSTGWDPTWRCKSLRSVAGVLVAINVTKGATAYPTMVKTSDYMVFDTPPAIWVAATTNSATENILPDLQEPLVDGFVMRDRMILYSENETWSMEPRYDDQMFSYRRLFTEHGMISQNCAAEVNNIHYVFGANDIWFHDGFKPNTLAGGRVRNFIFDNLVRDYHHLFFVQHNARLNEVLFCYLSTDPYCHYPVGGTAGYPGCNRAAVFNYRSGLWYFYDLPYTTSMGIGSPFSGSTYTSMGALTYTSLGGATYSSFGSSSAATSMAVSPSVTGAYGTLSAAVRPFDRYVSNAANGVSDLPANAPTILENSLMDLDDFDENLRNYKVVKRLYPEARLTVGSAPMYFSWAVTDYPSSPDPIYEETQSFDGLENYHLDFRTPGRYLNLKVTFSDIKDFQLSGLDFEYVRTGRR